MDGEYKGDELKDLNYLIDLLGDDAEGIWNRHSQKYARDFRSVREKVESICKQRNRAANNVVHVTK